MDKEQAQSTLAELIVDEVGIPVDELVNNYNLEVKRLEEDIITFDGYILEFELEKVGESNDEGSPST
jgi:hypothetical protein